MRRYFYSVYPFLFLDGTELVHWLLGGRKGKPSRLISVSIVSSLAVHQFCQSVSIVFCLAVHQFCPSVSTVSSLAVHKF